MPSGTHKFDALQMPAPQRASYCRRAHRHSIGPLAAALLVAAGCGHAPEATYQVHGTATVDGQRLPGGVVLFESINLGSSGRRYSARGRISAEGQYELTTFREKDGAVGGRHRVAVIPSQNVGDAALPDDAAKVPARYTALATTPLVFDVTAGDNQIDLALTSDSP